MVTKKTDHMIPYHNKQDVNRIIDKISNINIKGTCYLLVLAGKYQKGKHNLLNEISSRFGEMNSVDMREIISTNEEETYQKIDKLFNSIPKEDKYIYLENCDVLSGEYTGFTYSTNRYATPQEKYLLNKIKSSEKVVLMDIMDMANVHHTLRRFAQEIISFESPTGLFGKLLWKVQQIRIQGHTFENKRPLNVR